MTTGYLGHRPTIRETASVTTRRTINGRKQRRRPIQQSADQPITKHITVDPQVMAAAKQALRPGQRLHIVDARTVRLINS